MIKLLYKLFSKQLNSLVFEKGVIHNNWKDHCKIYYIDKQGRKYYLYRNLENLSLTRLQYLNKLRSLMEAGFKEIDKDLFIEDWGKKIDNIVNTMDRAGRIKDLSDLRTSLELLKARFNVYVEPDVLLSMMAVILIREDEEPAPLEISNTIIDGKIKQFKEDDKLRDCAFFLNSGLTKYMPYLTGLKENWNQSMESTKETLKSINDLERELMSISSKT